MFSYLDADGCSAVVSLVDKLRDIPYNNGGFAKYFFVLKCNIAFFLAADLFGRRREIAMSLYLSRIEGSPPKRNAPGSNPGKDAKKLFEIFSKSFFFIFQYVHYIQPQVEKCQLFFYCAYGHSPL